MQTTAEPQRAAAKPDAVAIVLIVLIAVGWFMLNTLVFSSFCDSRRASNCPASTWSPILVSFASRRPEILKAKVILHEVIADDDHAVCHCQESSFRTSARLDAFVLGMKIGILGTRRSPGCLTNGAA